MIVSILICLLLSAFFSGMEIAYISANRVQIELSKNKRRYGLLDYLLSRPRAFIVTMLLGNNVALVVYGILMEDTLSGTINFFFDIPSPFITLLIQTLISTLFILFLAEFIPKALFRNFASESLVFFALPAYVLQKLFSPFTWGIVKISSFILSLMQGDKEKEDSLDTKNELRFLLSEQIEESGNNDVETEIQIFRNALYFAETKARESMVPRNEICAMEITEDVDELKNKFIETGFSKILIYREKIDDIVGYVHAYEIFKRPPNIRSVLFPVEFVHETMLAREVMDLLLKKKKGVAVVLDEYGGTSGMLTVEDVVEELFGEIEDEHDQKDRLEEKLADNKYLFSARLEVDYLNEHYGLSFPISDSYETLGGVFFSYLGDIPQKKEEVRVGDYLLIAEKVSETKVENVLVIHLEA